MTLEELKPSHFKDIQPWESTSAKRETEDDARRFMHILSRHGDQWGLAWGQYQQSTPDGWPQWKFDKFAAMFPDADAATRFCPGWHELLTD